MLGLGLVGPRQQTVLSCSRLEDTQMPGPPHTGGGGSIGKAIAWAVVAFALWSAFRIIRES